MLVAGFLLTGVVGGLLGHYLQRRSFAYQQRTVRTERHQTEATNVFDEVSRLLDRRRYRMDQVFWALKRGPQDEHLQDRWSDYRQVMYEWNDTVNRNRALIARYFGNALSQQFERGVGENFVRYGRMLESVYRERRTVTEDEAQKLQGVSAELNHQIWHFDDALVERIRDGRVGAEV
jgi:hypothetical protein